MERVGEQVKWATTVSAVDERFQFLERKRGQNYLFSAK